MRLDELIEKLEQVVATGVPPEYPVTVILDSLDHGYPIDRVEPHADGVRIRLE